MFLMAFLLVLSSEPWAEVCQIKTGDGEWGLTANGDGTASSDISYHGSCSYTNSSQGHYLEHTLPLPVNQYFVSFYALTELQEQAGKDDSLTLFQALSDNNTPALSIEILGDHRARLRTPNGVSEAVSLGKTEGYSKWTHFKISLNDQKVTFAVNGQDVGTPMDLPDVKIDAQRLGYISETSPKLAKYIVADHFVSSKKDIKKHQLLCRGDTDDDGEIALNDLDNIISKVLMINMNKSIGVYDINGDGVVALDDVQMIIEAVQAATPCM